jgi:hypothetical protein
VSKTVSSLLRVAVLVCTVLLLAACTTNPAPPAASESTSGSTSTSAPAENSAAKGGGGGWLDGMPATVPPFTYGTLDSDQSSKAEVGESTLYTMYYEGVTKANVTEYLEKLKAAGFKIDLDPNVDAGSVSAAGELKKGDTKLMGLSISLQSGGHVDYALNVSKAAE